MKPRTLARSVAGAAGVAAASYGAVVACSFARYGRPRAPKDAERDMLLDSFMPEYEVVDRHQVKVNAPADTTLGMASERDLLDSPFIRMIFRARELALGGGGHAPRMPKGMVEECLSLGWVKLAEVPGREVVMGAVTKPWHAEPEFRSIPPDQFAAFNEPDYVKIVWTLRADPTGPNSSIFRTETRVATTDAEARRKFRVYWSFFGVGVWMIRRFGLAPFRQAAEERAAA